LKARQVVTDGFDPYHKWLGIPPAEQPPNHYRLLGISLFESDLDVIANAADQRMAHVRTFQAGRRSAESQKILNEISAAKICLLNAEKKAAYDEQLRAKTVKPHPVEKPRPALPVATPLEPEPAAEPAPVIEGGPAAVAAAPRSSARLSSARRSQSWQVWAATGGVIAVMLVVAVYLIITAGPEEVGQEGQNNPPIAKRKEPPEEKPTPKPPEEKPKLPEEKPKAKPPEEKPKPKPPKEKPKQSPEPLFGPVPDAAALKEAEGQLGDVPADAPPSKLIDEANADGRSRAQRYVLLSRARQSATGDGDVKDALGAVDEIHKRFEIDVPALKAETRAALGKTLRQLAEKADAPKAHRAVAENCLRLVDEAKAAGEKDLAKALAPIALASARKSEDSDLIKRATIVFLEMQ